MVDSKVDSKVGLKAGLWKVDPKAGPLVVQMVDSKVDSKVGLKAGLWVDLMAASKAGLKAD
eukprot:scaffold11280_cov214-Ochromonas_danica.AAC.5